MKKEKSKPVINLKKVINVLKPGKHAFGMLISSVRETNPTYFQKSLLHGMLRLTR